jgi:hypothetical protein
MRQITNGIFYVIAVWLFLWGASGCRLLPTVLPLCGTIYRWLASPRRRPLRDDQSSRGRARP